MSGAQGIARMSAATEKRLGLPENIQFYSAFPFQGMNQQAARTAMDDKEFFWLENFLITGPASMRTLWDRGTALYTASGQTIVYVSFYNIGTEQYAAVFFSDGTAAQVGWPSGAVTIMSAVPNLFYNAAIGQKPAAVQSGTQYLLISNNQTKNDYWIWDGHVLYSAGSIGPTDLATLTSGGTGYGSVPSYTVYGGSGSGVVLTPVISEGSVVSLTVDNPGSGYLPGEIVQVAFSGGGSDTTPILQAVLDAQTISHLTLISGGAGYPDGTFSLGFSGGGGSGAAGLFTVVGGTVTGVALTDGGSGYTSGPTITFPIPGLGGSVTATEVAGSVTMLTLVNGGSGYVPGTYPLIFSGGGGSGAQATYTVNLSGVIDTLLLIAGGTGYTTNPTVTIPVGSGASAIPILSAGTVVSVTVVNGGTGMTGTPTLTFSGGGGSGAAAVAEMAGGSIASVTVTAGGSGYTTAPAIEVQVGLNNAASAILQLMPFGVSGTAIETFLSRVWISFPNQQGRQNNGGALVVSTPGSLTDFAPADGGLLFNSSDRFLRQSYVALRQSNGYLYTLGDSSVSVINNVQTSGVPVTTTFNYQNASSQIGAAWRDSAQDYNQGVLFANINGIQGLYGGSVRRVSNKVNNIFETAAFAPTTPGALSPSSAVANIFTIPIYLLLMTITDPVTKAHRNVMLGWDEKEWIVATQSTPLTFICTQVINSKQTAWGTDGTALFPMFARPSALLQKKIITKLYGGEREYIIKEPLSINIRTTDRSVSQGGIAGTITMEASQVALQRGQAPFVTIPPVSYANPIQPDFTVTNSPYAVWNAITASLAGTSLGATITTNSEDFLLSGISIGYRDTASIFD